MVVSSMSKSAPPLAKSLASNDKSIRDLAVKHLTAFLSDDSGDVLDERDMAKLWKGIWYCFWMSDKPLVQQALAQELTDLVLKIPRPAAAMAFLRGFWAAAVREWGGLDRFRLDKFYMLVRRYINAAFRLLLKAGWSAELCREWNDMLTCPGGPLCPDDSRVPVGLAFHIADVYLEELDKVLQPSPSTLASPAPLSIILAPLFAVLAQTLSKTTREYFHSTLLIPILAALKPPVSVDRRKRSRVDAFDNLLSNACLDCPGSESALDRDQLRIGLLKMLFEIASREETRPPNRKLMLSTYGEYKEDGTNSPAP